MLDGLDGLRAGDMPVIVLTACDCVTDTVGAFEGGADDYMPKPFRFAELRARVRVRLRQATPKDGPRDQTSRLVVGPVTLDLLARTVTREGHTTELSAREYQVLELFMRNAGQVLSREQLLSHVWGYDYDPGSNVVDVYVGYRVPAPRGAASATARPGGPAIAAARPWNAEGLAPGCREEHTGPWPPC